MMMQQTQQSKKTKKMEHTQGGDPTTFSEHRTVALCFSDVSTAIDKIQMLKGMRTLAEVDWIWYGHLRQMVINERLKVVALTVK